MEQIVSTLFANAGGQDAITLCLFVAIFQRIKNLEDTLKKYNGLRESISALTGRVTAQEAILRERARTDSR